MSKKKSINKASAKASKTSWLSRTWQAFTSDKTLFIIGILLLLASLYMALSFASYILSSGGIDQSVLEADGAAADYNNMGGKRGAWIAEVLINRSFGITACIIPILTAVYGLQLMRIRKGGFKLVRWTIICCSILIWGSVFTNVTFGHLSDRMSYHIGGWHGKFVTDWLTNQIGLTGVFIVLFITAILFCIYLTSDTITFIRRLFHPSSFLPGKDEEEEEYIVSDKTSDFNLQTSDEIPAKDSDAEVFSNSLKPAIKLSEKVPESEDEEEFVEGRPASDRTVHLTGEPGFDVTAASETETVSKLQHEEEKGPYDPKKDLSRYKYPTLDLLNKGGDDAIAIDREEQDKNYHDITETLRSFGIEISSIKGTVGPTITLYEITPAPGIKISRIKNLEEDIALSLKALGIRIIAPMPGRGTIGIEVPNRKAQTVSMYSVLASKKFQECDYSLPVAIGKTITNEVFTFDLAKAPHLLVAGATGQGKSVGLNAIITSLLFKKHPAELKFVLVDPKKVELSIYNTIDHHFLAKLEDEEDAIITDVDKVVRTLKSLCKEMDDRYDLLKAAGVRGIKDYNEKFKNRQLNPKQGHRYLPYIVVVIDEYGDLIMTAGKAVELPICRIAQLARAVGMHMIIATQRPTANIITGTIKANFPTRIAFKVMSPIDSRVILERTGANNLVGRGDMLYLGTGDPVRIQCAFVDTPEVERIGEYIHKQQAYPIVFPLPEVVEETESGPSDDFDAGHLDPLFEEAAQLVVSRQQGSTSTIQRQFAIGYNRAGRIMDQLEQAGVVGPAQGSKPRQVLIQDLLELENILSNLREK
ncbi:MAG: DNA translocase FtsK 4TM domain-containing protein [Bacteroidaceae bacterium]|nr:DNA translocase FtsK 4TM domain-containing protein [Bacteroidaceae bacterium]